MQFVDIAVASGYAALCLSLMVMMNPVADKEAAVEAGASSKLDFAMLSYIEQAGLPFFTTASNAAICASAQAADNSTFSFEASVGGVGCANAGPPPDPLGSSTLSLLLPGRTVVVEAWLEAQ